MPNGGRHQFPIRGEPHVIEDTSLRILREQLPQRWIVRPNDADYGLDGEIEIVSTNNVVRGDIFKFQAKGHSTIEFLGNNVIQRVRVTTINYWLEVPLPVVLFVIDVGQGIVYWVDVKSYVRDTLSRDRPNWRQQITTQIKIPIKNQLPGGLRGIRNLVMLYKERIRLFQTALEELEEERLVSDFVGYHIFIRLFDGDIDAWDRYLRDEGSVQQLLDDFPFVVWLKNQLEEDPDLVNRIRRLVQNTALV